MGRALASTAAPSKAASQPLLGPVQDQPPPARVGYNFIVCDGLIVRRRVSKRPASPAGSPRPAKRAATPSSATTPPQLRPPPPADHPPAAPRASITDRPFDAEQIAQAVLSECSTSAADGSRAHLAAVCRTALAHAANAAQESHPRAAERLRAASDDVDLATAFVDSADMSQQQQASSAAPLSQLLKDQTDAARAETAELKCAAAAAEARRTALRAVRERVPSEEPLERPAPPPARGVQRRLVQCRDKDALDTATGEQLASVLVRPHLAALPPAFTGT